VQSPVLECELGHFLRNSNPHKKFRSHVPVFADTIYDVTRTRVSDEKAKKAKPNASVTEKEEKLLIALVLVCSKFATETAPFKFSQEYARGSSWPYHRPLSLSCPVLNDCLPPRSPPCPLVPS
jgi:hypothetical protein